MDSQTSAGFVHVRECEIGDPRELYGHNGRWTS